MDSIFWPQIARILIANFIPCAPLAHQTAQKPDGFLLIPRTFNSLNTVLKGIWPPLSVNHNNAKNKKCGIFDVCIMKTKTLRKNKVNVVTLGCSKNLVDSEVLMGQLKANKFDVEHEGENDDHEIVIINTCGFVENAKQESIDTILRYVEAKKEGGVS